MIDLTRLLDAVDLADLITKETGAKLTKSGRSYMAPCPLHKSKSQKSDFSVYEGADGAQLWHCHSRCATGGDAIGFIMRWRNAVWLEAVRYLAEYANLPLESLGLTEEAAQEHQARARRSDVLDMAAVFFHQQFSGSPAEAYVAGRRFAPETVAAAQFGYTAGDGKLSRHLATHNADLTLAGEIGLIRSDGRDFTANRDGQLVSPDGWLIYVHREHGRVVYLSARALSKDVKDKSRNLPGDKHLYRAEVPACKSLVLVEGQATAETLRQFNQSAWALCGVNGLRESDVAAIRRRRPVFLALDSDGTGRERTAAVASEIGPLVMIVPALPGGYSDFNDWLMEKSA